VEDPEKYVAMYNVKKISKVMQKNSKNDLK
jgi:hypothetical protein